MKTKKEIVDNWLVRYTGVALEDFGELYTVDQFSALCRPLCTAYRSRGTGQR